MSRSSISVKRIYADMKELRTDPSDQYSAQPREDDLFDWHFTIRGPIGTSFEGGLYHGRILLPIDYPFKPPNIIFLTQNGRFELRKKICLSISAYHPETWQPAWGIRTILEALISFFPTKGEGAVGALDWTSDERKRLVLPSQEFRCSVCKEKNKDLIPKLKKKDDSKKTTTKKKSTKFADQISQMHMHAATGKLAVGSNGGESGESGESGGSGSTGGGSGGSGGSGSNGGNETTNGTKKTETAMRQRQQTRTTQPPAATTTPAAPRTTMQQQQQQPPAVVERNSSTLLYLAILLGCGVMFLLYRKISRTIGRVD